MIRENRPPFLFVLCKCCANPPHIHHNFLIVKLPLLSYPDNVVCKPFVWIVFIPLDNQYFKMFDYTDSIK